MTTHITELMWNWRHSRKFIRFRPPPLPRQKAMFLMMAHVFKLGCRRYEWKCDFLNLPSCRAAQRLGFSFEGILRQASNYTERNRDTAWFSVINSEWTQLRQIYETWFGPRILIQMGFKKNPFLLYRNLC